MTATVCSFLFLLLLLLALAPGSLRAQTTSPTVPGAPKYIEGVRQDGRIWVHWGSPYDNGGAVVTGYDLRYIRSDADTTVDGNWTIKLAVSTVAGWDYVMGLTNGVEYHVQVRAVNEVGAGAWSVSFTAAPVGNPSPPVIISVTPGDGTLTVSWSAPEDDGGSNITEYRVRHIRSDAPGKPFIAWTGKRGIAGSTLQYVIGGLTIGVRYDVQVRATNASGGGSDYSATVTGTPRTTPNAPSINLLTPADGALTVAWSAPGDTGGAAITGYDLRYIRSDAADKAGGNWTVVEDVWSRGDGALQYALGGLTNWVGYDVQVRAENSEGTGPWSATTTGTPGNLPSAPTIVKLFDIPGIFQVDWSAPADNGGAAIIDYHVRLTRGAGTQVYDNFWEPGDPLAQGFGAPGSSTEYGAEVRAVNPAGPGPWSAKVTFTTGSISAPVMAAGSPGDGQILVTWQAPDKGADGITTYDLRYIRSDADKSVGANWFLGEGKWSSGPLQYTITGLDNGVEYDVQVRAVRGLVRGPWSASTTAKPGTTLASPTINSLTPGDGALVVAWSAPANSGDASITGYDLRYIRRDAPNKDDANWTVRAGVWSSGALRYDLGGLDNGVGYDLQVRGVNSVGAGAWSSSASGTPQTVPGRARTTLSVTPGDELLTVMWSAPVDDGGSKITGYDLRYIRRDAPDKDDANWTVKAGIWSSGALRYTLGGLDNGVGYDVQVRGVNSVGAGAWSASGIGKPRTTPEAPSINSLTPGEGTLAVAWSAPGDDGGADITGYDLRYIRSDAPDKDDANWTVKAGVWSSGELRYDLGGLDNGAGYDVQARAANIAGGGEWSASITGTPRTTPGAPTINSLTPGDGALTVAWSAPGDDGGADITSYDLRYIRSDAPDKDGANWTVKAGVWSSGELRYTLGGLDNGVGYDVQVRAGNSVGPGSWSNSHTGTPRTTPGAPTIGSLTPGDETLKLAWSAPGDDGGADITSYDLRYIRSDAPDKDGANWTVKAGVWSSGDRQYALGGLTNGAGYDVQVRAGNIAGDGEWSGSVSGVPETVPAAPTIDSLTAGDGALAVAWTAPTETGGLTIQSYDLRYIRSDAPDKADANWTLEEGAGSPGSLEQTFDGLSNGDRYDVQLRAVTSAGDGPWSASASGTPRTMPQAPSISSTTPGDSALAVAWSAPADDGGSTITGYDLRYIRSDAPDKADANWSEERDAGSSGSLGYTITALTNGVEYDVQVRAVNAAGHGPWSASASGTPQAVAQAPNISSTTPGDECAGGGLVRPRRRWGKHDHRLRPALHPLRRPGQGRRQLE